MKFKCLLSVVVISFIHFILLASDYNLAYAKKARGVERDHLKIGAILDFTGATSNIGVLMNLSYKNIFKHINDNGGIHGRKINLTIEDDHYSIPAGISAFKKLVYKDQVLTIMGPASVGETKVLMRHIQKNKVPQLPWAPDKSITKPYKRYIFPTSGFYDNEWGIILDHIINNLKPKKLKIALCYPDVESGKVVRDLAQDWADFFGVKLHLEIVPLSAIDVTSQVLSMKRVHVTHILMHHVAPGAVAVLKDMKKLGLNVPMFGTSAASTEDVITIGGESSKNFIGVSPYSSFYEESPGMAQVRNISMKYNPKEIASYRNKGYLFGWVIAEIVCEALRRAGKDVDGEKFVDALETFEGFDTKGLCGLVTYTPNMHYGLKYNKLFKTDIENKELVPITDWKLPPSKR